MSKSKKGFNITLTNEKIKKFKSPEIVYEFISKLNIPCNDPSQTENTLKNSIHIYSDPSCDEGDIQSVYSLSRDPLSSLNLDANDWKSLLSSNKVKTFKKGEKLNKKKKND